MRFRLSFEEFVQKAGAQEFRCRLMPANRVVIGVCQWSAANHPAKSFNEVSLWFDKTMSGREKFQLRGWFN
jgi:hypothetical protein